MQLLRSVIISIEVVLRRTTLTIFEATVRNLLASLRWSLKPPT